MNTLNKIAEALRQDDLNHALASLTEQQLIDQLAELSKSLRLEHARLRADKNIKRDTYYMQQVECQEGARANATQALRDAELADENFAAFCLRVKALNAAARGLVEKLSEFRVA